MRKRRRIHAHTLTNGTQKFTCAVVTFLYAQQHTFSSRKSDEEKKIYIFFVSEKRL